MIQNQFCGYHRSIAYFFARHHRLFVYDVHGVKSLYRVSHSQGRSKRRGC